MDSMVGGIYDYQDESTRFCREKYKTKNINKPYFVMKVHHINKDS